MSTTDLMLLPAPDPPGAARDPMSAAERGRVPAALTVLHLEAGRWRPQPPPTAGITPAEALDGVEDLLEDIVGELDDPAPVGYLDAMQERMQTMFNAVVPGELARKLDAEAGAAVPGDPPVLRLHIAPQLDPFPWELMHDGTSFLGLRYRIARMPLVFGGPKPTNGTPRPVESVVSLLGENVLQAGEREAWRDTFKDLVKATDVTRRPQTDDWPTLNALKETPADVLYLVCHGLRSERGDVFWSLNDNRPGSPTLSIRPAQAQTLNLKVREPLVFANACHPLEGSTAATTRDIAAAGFGFQFFSFGASAFVGTIAPISKRVALPFARAFFEKLLEEHLAIGDALLATKQLFFERGDPDPSYLFYALYGDPNSLFSPGA